MNTISKIIGDYELFLDKIFSNFKKSGFEESEFKELDHICYRVETLERYEEIKKELARFSSNWSEVEISGRSIMVCKLSEPLVYKNNVIHCLEMAAPRAGKFFKEGLEHAEFVTKTSFSEFLEKHKDLNFEMKSYQREVNPELILEFDDCAVKFHTQSILEIRKM